MQQFISDIGANCSYFTYSSREQPCYSSLLFFQEA